MPSPVPPVKNPAPQLPSSREAGQKAAKPPAPRRGSGVKYIFIFLLLVALGLLIYFLGILPRQAAAHDLTREQKLNTQQIVLFRSAELAPGQIILPLPASLSAFQQTSLYAQTSGYVKSWQVDIGQIVHEGDVLAVLNTPEVDQQLAQAQATLEQAKANLAIAKSTADRYNQMQTLNAVAQQDVDEKNATRDSSQAATDAAAAEVQRLTVLENYKEIRAPFDGIVTFRGLDIGNLVTNGASEVYRVAQVDPIRVYVHVPEVYAAEVQAGQEAKITVNAYPGRIFSGKVVRNAGAVDAASRTLLTEIQVPNPEGTLLPGGYAQVALSLTDTTPHILIPANTLLVNASGTQVVQIRQDNGQAILHYVPVTVGRDFGAKVEILNGLESGDQLVTNPAADLYEGEVVTPQSAEAPAPKP